MLGSEPSPASTKMIGSAPSDSASASQTPMTSATSMSRLVALSSRSRSSRAARARIGKAAPTTSCGTPMSTSVTRNAVAK